MKIKDLMTAHVVTLKPHDTLQRAQELFTYYEVSALPVLDADGPQGIITTTDMARGHSDQDLVKDVMAKRVHSVPQIAGAHVAARLMRKHRIHHLLVTDETGVVGLISSFDLLKLISE